jgi:hypothetical protein
MQFLVRLSPDRVAGFILAAIGATAFSAAMGYGFGTLGNIGPGALPAAVSAIIFLCGVALCLDPGSDTEDLPTLALRPMLSVLGGIAAWALVAPRFGLVPGTFLLVLMAALGMDRPRWKAALITAGVLAAIGSVVFTWLLGMQLPILRWA